MLTQPPLASSLLAFVTTIHFALVLLRNHRRSASGAINTPTLVSLALAATPWLMPSLPGVMLGLAAHGLWFAACERLASPMALATAATDVASPVSPVAGRAAATRARRTNATAAVPGSAGRATSNTFVQVPVIATVDETDDIRTIRIARPDGYEFEAGQFVTVRMRVDAKECVRCYSISSAPEARGYLELSVKRQGVVSNALHATAQPGALLSIRSPNGSFKYPANDDRPIVLLAGGVGITPLMSMLRHAIYIEPTRPVTLLYAAQTERNFAFRDELLAIARRHPQVRVFFIASRAKASRANIHAGRIDKTLLRNAVPAVAHSIALVCGPEPMIATMKTLLAECGMPPAQIRHEVFQAAVAASSALERLSPATAKRRTGGVHEMQCSVSGTTVPIAAGETLLEAAEKHGIAVASLCRAGVCGTCRTRVTAGDVDCASTTLDSAELAQGYVLACVATARSACTVEL